jgi:hypothetical protein
MLNYGKSKLDLRRLLLSEYNGNIIQFEFRPFDTSGKPFFIRETSMTIGSEIDNDCAEIMNEMTYQYVLTVFEAKTNKSPKIKKEVQKIYEMYTMIPNNFIRNNNQTSIINVVNIESPYEDEKYNIQSVSIEINLTNK